MDGTKFEAGIEVNEEHTKLIDPTAELAIGEKVMIIPGHCCSTVNLYNKIYLYRGEKVVDRINVTARGMSI